MPYKNKKVKYLCLATFLFHFSICHIIMPMNDAVNVFPFYNWNLFSYVPSKVSLPLMRILEIDNQPLTDKPLIFHTNLIPESNQPWLCYTQVERFVSLVFADHEKTQDAQTEMEKNLFSRKNQVKYEVFWGEVHLRNLLTKDEIISSGDRKIFVYGF